MTDPNSMKQTTMMQLYKNRNNNDSKLPTTSPTPIDKKTLRSSAKGKKPMENEGIFGEKEVNTADAVIAAPTARDDEDAIKGNMTNNKGKANEESEGKNNHKKTMNKNKTKNEINERNGVIDSDDNESYADDDEAAGEANERNTTNDDDDSVEIEFEYKSEDDDDEEGDDVEDDDEDTDDDDKEVADAKKAPGTITSDKEDTDDSDDDSDDDGGNDNEIATAARDATKQKAGDKGKYCLDLHGKGFKKQTTAWNDTPDGVMKNSQTLINGDEAYIHDIMEDVGIAMGKKVTTLDKDSWIKIFIETKDIIAARNKKRFIRIFGVSLASSDPKGLFDPDLFDGNQLLASSMTNVWAAAYTLYGPGWLHEKPVFHLDGKGIAPTKLAKECAKSTITKAKVFQASDIFLDSPDSLHNLEISMKRLLKIKVKGKEVIEPAVWAKAMAKNFKDLKVQTTCLRLAKTPVTTFKELEMLNGNELDKIAITSIWMGAQQLLGAISPTQQKAPDPIKPANKPSNKPNHAPTSRKPGVQFTPETKAASKPGTRLFISKDKPKAASPSSKISTRKYTGFYKAKLPLTVNPFGPKAIEEVTAHWSNLTELIWSIDKKAEILPWHSNSSVKALIKGTDEIKTKEQLGKFVANVYVAQNQNTWLRFHIAHDVEKDKFEPDLFTEIQIQLSYDKVQAKRTSIWGWMLGAIPDTANVHDMKAAFENHPVLKKFQIEARTQVIRIYSGKQQIPSHLQVKAIHIIGDDTQTAEGRKAYNLVFGSRNVGGYPQQRVMRFVPNIADNRFPATPGRVKDVVKMIGKQKKITGEALPIQTDTIAGLHYFVPELGYTLCQILMSMRSSRDPATQLFMAVDERMWGTYAVSFTVHKDRYAEANSLIPLLSVVLQAKFGARIWEWFTDTAKISSQGYEYDTATGRLTNTEEDDLDESSIESDDEFLQELKENLNLTDANDSFDIDLTFMLDDVTPKNQYGDTGSVKTFRSIEDKTPNDTDTTANNSTKSFPENMSVTTQDSLHTQETSTITETTSIPEQSFEYMCRQNPVLLQRFLQSNPHMNTASTPGASTPNQNTDPQNAPVQQDDAGNEAS